MTRHIYAFGFNGHGQVDPNSEDILKTPIKLDFHPFQGIHLEGISSNWDTSCAWSESKVFIWGFGAKLFSTTKDPVGLVEISLPFLHSIKSVEIWTSEVNQNPLFSLYIQDNVRHFYSIRSYQNRLLDVNGHHWNEREIPIICHLHENLSLSTNAKQVSAWVYESDITATLMTSTREHITIYNAEIQEIREYDHTHLISKIYSCPLNSAGNEKFIHLSSSDIHILGVTNHGNLHVWGQGRYGEFGDGIINTQIRTPPSSSLDLDSHTLVEKLEGIRIIAADGGTGFSFALTHNGHLYSWGNNKKSQLARGQGSDFLLPDFVEFNASEDPMIKSITCGIDHVIALDMNGGVWHSGSNKYGQLGELPTNSLDKRSEGFELSSKFRRGVLTVSCKGWHSLLLIET